MFIPLVLLVVMAVSAFLLFKFENYFAGACFTAGAIIWLFISIAKIVSS